MYAGVPVIVPCCVIFSLAPVDRARDAEVRHHGVPAGEENVLRLDVAVHDAALVRVGQRAGHLAADPHAPRRATAGCSAPSRCRSDSPSTYGIT